jgi:thymidylate synthase (FAD)
MSKEIKCLDKGFVRLVDSMGDDSSIVQAARVSYGKGTKKISEDRGLIRYLLRNAHTTPFEMVTMKFHCKMPIFAARQWIRHRCASTNEISARYSEMPNEFYVPEEEHVTFQNPDNKQGGTVEPITPLNVKNPSAWWDDEEFSREDIDSDMCWSWQEKFIDEQQHVRQNYEKYLKSGMRKELARINMPVSQYTEWYWQMNLHNLFHFLKLRQDHHAQYEMRVYADAIFELIKPIVPIACEAYIDYIKESIRLSRLEIEFLQQTLKQPSWDEYFQQIAEAVFENKREREECLSKFKILFS